MPSDDVSGLKRLENKVRTLERYLGFHLKADKKFPRGNPRDRLAVILGWFDNCWERVQLFRMKCEKAPLHRRSIIGLKLMEIRSVLGLLWDRIETYRLGLLTEKISPEVDRRVVTSPQQAGKHALLMAAPMGNGVRLC